MKLQLQLYPEANVLLQKAEPVEKFDSELSDIAFGMIDLMRECEGVGLAAPQVGISKRLIVVDDVSRNSDIVTILVNPTWTPWYYKRKRSIESCLSIPGISGPVTRWSGIELTWYNLLGEKKQSCVYDTEARIVQHETDHLDGWLYPFYNLRMYPTDYFVRRDPRPFPDFGMSLVDSMSLI